MPSSNFIHAVEIWVPTTDRLKLTLKSGHYGEHEYFERISRGMQFAYDEGLPGKCWASGEPIVLKDLRNSYFRRGDAAMTEGLDCAVAIPAFVGPDLKAVLVYFCGAGKHQVGALEVWHAPSGMPQMGLSDGYFGIAEKFEFTSRNTKFPPKSGLPGMIWDSGLPLIMEDLGRGEQFLRRDSAEKVGINRAVGLPCQARSKADSWVLTFLSARNSPIARRFELWSPDEPNGVFRYTAGYCEYGTEIAGPNAAMVVPLDAGPLGESRIAKMPVLAKGANIAPFSHGEGLEDAAMLVIPVFQGEVFAASLVAYL